MNLDALIQFPEIYLPLGGWIDDFVAWLTVEGAPVFKVISTVLRTFLVRLERFLMALPWTLVVLTFAVVSWRTVNWRTALGVVGGLMFIGFIGLWLLAMKTLALIIAATVIAIIMAVPIGIAMARSDLLDGIIRPLLDLMQTMPSFVYLVPALMLFGLGPVPALIATVIYAVPPAIRLTNLGIRQVSKEVIEAGHAFGSTPQQILFKLQLPLAVPTIMAGINQTVMMALAMVVIASMIGAGGLGAEVLNGLARLEVGRAFNGGISIVILAVIIDRVSQRLVKQRPASSG